MKLITDDLLTKLLEDGLPGYLERALREAPEAHPLDLAKLERFGFVDEYAEDFVPMTDGPYVRYADLLGAVQPDPKVLLAFVERIANESNVWDELAREALSAYRGGK